MKYLQFNDQHILCARFTEEINGTAVPANAIPVDDALFWQTVQESDGIWQRDPISGSISKQAFPLPDVASQIEQTRASVNAWAERQLAVLASEYPQGEVSSWAQQLREADAIQDNEQADAPLLHAIATARGIAISELANRVKKRATEYSQQSGQIIGQRQAWLDQLSTVDTAANNARQQLDAIMANLA